MHWLSRLFSRNHPVGHSVKPSIVIPIPEGTDPKMWERVREPVRNRKKYTAGEMEADAELYKKEMREQFTCLSQFNRERALRVGSKSFIWRSARDANVCPECAQNEGKRFSYNKPPKIGYPGEHECPIGWCRCYAEPVFAR